MADAEHIATGFVRALVVGADERETSAARATLALAGVDVVVASSGPTALAELWTPNRHFDVIAVDARSVTLSAWELSLVVDLARSRVVPLIIISRRPPADEVVRAGLVAGWLQRPYAVEDFVRLVARHAPARQACGQGPRSA
jgi:DNA-binding response OmpR family regulator